MTRHLTRLTFILVLVVASASTSIAAGLASGVTAPPFRGEIQKHHVGSGAESSSVLTEHGTTRYLGNGQYIYSTVLGETNTLDDGEYVPYIYDDGTHSVAFAGHRLALYDWYATFENSTHVLVDDMRWTVEYFREQGGGAWRTLDLWEHSFLPVTEGSRLQFGQHYTDGFSTLDVWYTVRNNDQFKVTLNFTPSSSRIYRFVWHFYGVDGTAEECPNGLAFSDVNIGWGDAPVNATYDWSAADRKVDITFDAIAVQGGETYTLDPSVHPTMGADSDDDTWFTNDGSPPWTHATGYTTVQVKNYTPGPVWYYGQNRFSLAIAQGATVDSANWSMYEDYDIAVRTFWVRRINEDDVGSLEADTEFPSLSNTTIEDYTSDGSTSGYSVINVTDTTHEQVNLGGWASGQYIGFAIQYDTTAGGLHKWDDYQHADPYHAYMNVTYTVGAGNNAPTNDGCTLTNPSDTDNLYANLQDYIFTTNVSDADGYADIDYVEMSAYSAGVYWTVRYDEDTDTFSEEVGASYIVLSGSSAAVESGNDIDVTWLISIEWGHGDVDNYDLRVYTVDDEPESDTDDYDLNYDYETRLDITTGPALSDGAGTVDRGDYNVEDGITATGTIDYFGSAISPPSDEVDVWISCADVAGSPWSDLTLTDGAFSMTVDSDDIVGLDSYTVKLVAEGAGSGGADQSHASHSDTYIADRLDVTIAADDTSVVNGTQVNFTLTVVYDFDDSSCTVYNLTISNDAVAWFAFTNGNKSLFNDTDADDTNAYTVLSVYSEATHNLTAFTSNSESVTWSAEGATTTTTTDSGVVYVVESWDWYDQTLLLLCAAVIAILILILWKWYM